MSKAISMDRICEACLDGIDYSFEEYYEWSSGEWLWNAPEYLLTVNIAKKIMELEGGKYLTLEDNVKSTLKDAGDFRKGRLSKYLRANGRSDIILWWAEGTPRGIIEVKHRVYKFGSFQEDVDRIIEVLKKDSDIQFGISTFYIENNYKGEAETKMEHRIETLFQQTKEYLKEYAPNLKAIYDKNIYEEGDDVRASVAILIKRA